LLQPRARSTTSALKFNDGHSSRTHSQRLHNLSPSTATQASDPRTPAARVSHGTTPQASHSPSPHPAVPPSSMAVLIPNHTAYSPTMIANLQQAFQTNTPALLQGETAKERPKPPRTKRPPPRSTCTTTARATLEHPPTNPHRNPSSHQNPRQTRVPNPSSSLQTLMSSSANAGSMPSSHQNPSCPSPTRETPQRNGSTLEASQRTLGRSSPRRCRSMQAGTLRVMRVGCRRYREWLLPERRLDRGVGGGRV